MTHILNVEVRHSAFMGIGANDIFEDTHLFRHFFCQFLCPIFGATDRSLFACSNNSTFQDSS